MGCISFIGNNRYSCNYIYFTSDESFDYLGPFGTETCHQKGLHGFSITFDENDEPILGSIDGFGEFADASDYIESWEYFYSWLLENDKYVVTSSDDDEVTSEALFIELYELVKKKIEKGLICNQ